MGGKCPFYKTNCPRCNGRKIPVDESGCVLMGGLIENFDRISNRLLCETEGMATPSGPETLGRGCQHPQIERVTGVHRDTILKLLVMVGEKCEKTIGRLIVTFPARMSSAMKSGCTSARRTPRRGRKRRTTTASAISIASWQSSATRSSF